MVFYDVTLQFSKYQSEKTYTVGPLEMRANPAGNSTGKTKEL